MQVLNPVEQLTRRSFAMHSVRNGDIWGNGQEELTNLFISQKKKFVTFVQS